MHISSTPRNIISRVTTHKFFKLSAFPFEGILFLVIAEPTFGSHNSEELSLTLGGSSVLWSCDKESKMDVFLRQMHIVQSADSVCPRRFPGQLFSARTTVTPY